MSHSNVTDVKEVIDTLGLGALAPKLAQELTNLGVRIDDTQKKGSIILKIDFNAHHREGFLVGKTTLTIEKPKANGVDKDVTNYKDVFRIDEDGLVVLSPSETSDLESK